MRGFSNGTSNLISPPPQRIVTSRGEDHPGISFGIIDPLTRLLVLTQRAGFRPIACWFLPSSQIFFFFPQFPWLSPSFCPCVRENSGLPLLEHLLAAVSFAGPRLLEVGALYLRCEVRFCVWSDLRSLCYFLSLAFFFFPPPRCFLLRNSGKHTWLFS